MRLRKIFACVLAMAAMPVIPGANAAELFSGVYSASELTYDDENGIVFEQAVPDGDYTVTVKTGGDTATDANIYINGGERVRAYTLEAGESRDNVQAAVPQDGKITVQVIGESPNVTEIDIEQLPDRTEPGEKTAIYIAGDSTAQTYNYETAFPQTGWGQVFGDHFTDDIVVYNRAIAGRSAKSFNNDGRLDSILTEMHPGDYVFIQFGINDGAADKPERYISAEDYKTLISDKYIGEVRKRGGIPVLLTPTAASWWDEENNCYMGSRQDYAVPTAEIAEETDTLLIDINGSMTEMWNFLGKTNTERMYFICEPLESKAYPSGTDDHTHLKAAGADMVAKLIAFELENTPLKEYLKPETEFEDISGHWAEDTIQTAKEFGIIDGVAGSAFEPDRSVTRAEFLKMAMDSAGAVSHAYREGECLEAESDDWYCYYLQGALDKGIIPEQMIKNCTGTEPYTKEIDDNVSADIVKYLGTDLRFDADEPITREEASVIAMNCADRISEDLLDAMNGIYGMEIHAFEDADKISEAYAGKVEYARRFGLVEGDDDHMFLPENELTRAEAAVIALRLWFVLNLSDYITATE